jgi:hypothetical protein
MSLRVACKALLLALFFFAAAFTLRRMFLWDVMPVSWDQEPQLLWALGAAFLLRSIENIASVVAAIVLAFVCTLGLDRWRGHPPPEILNSE